jgi:hypothetical protein
MNTAMEIIDCVLMDICVDRSRERRVHKWKVRLMER